jgi:hypothetical protein
LIGGSGRQRGTGVGICSILIATVGAAGAGRDHSDYRYTCDDCPRSSHFLQPSLHGSKAELTKTSDFCGSEMPDYVWSRETATKLPARLHLMFSVH